MTDYKSMLGMILYKPTEAGILEEYKVISIELVGPGYSDFLIKVVQLNKSEPTKLLLTKEVIREAFFFSPKKAKRVAAQMLDRQLRLAKKRADKRRAFDINKKNLLITNLDFLEREVTVAYRRKEDGTLEYSNTKIIELIPSEIEGVYYFKVERGSGLYRTDRKNKNWFFTTKKTKLQLEKERLQEELAEVERELSLIDLEKKVEGIFK